MMIQTAGNGIPSNGELESFGIVLDMIDRAASIPALDGIIATIEALLVRFPGHIALRALLARARSSRDLVRLAQAASKSLPACEVNGDEDCCCPACGTVLTTDDCDRNASVEVGGGDQGLTVCTCSQCGKTCGCSNGAPADVKPPPERGRQR